jgi:hypothetical protein
VARSRAAAIPSVAVLTRRDDVVAAGAAVALAIAAERRAPVAAVCLWTGEAVSATSVVAPASGSAHRLAQALARRGHMVRASRRLVYLTLPADEAEAAAEAARVAAACGAVPMVLALAGARGSRFDATLRACDLVVVASSREADPALESLALAGVASYGGRAIACSVPEAPVARLLAGAGAGLAPSVRGGLKAVVEALR